MKKHIHRVLSKPKSVIPVVAFLVLAVTIIAFRSLSHPPVVPSSLEISTPNSSMVSGNNISLSFAKGGRVSEVLVKEGDAVTAGQTLAVLSAPDALGAVSQAKGALDLAQAQYASLNSDYANTKTQQDLLVENARRKLLTTDLMLVPDTSGYAAIAPTISGTYNGPEGQYNVQVDKDNATSLDYQLFTLDLEQTKIKINKEGPTPLGSHGLYISFPNNDVASYVGTIWHLSIPNKAGPSYSADNDAYNLALNNRDKALSDILTKIGADGTGSSVAKAQVDAAEGAYQAALGAYQNNLITSPVDGVVTFIDENLKVGQSVVAGNPVISISQK